MTARYIYIDETKQRGYVIVASVHLTAELAAARAVIRKQLLPNQRYLHMKDEKDGRKRTIIEALIGAQIKVAVYRAGAHHKNERERRAACLRAIVEDNATGRDVRLIIHQDDTLVGFDNQRLIEYTREFGCHETLHRRHHRTHADLLLGIPDAVAWCCGKGGEWRQLVDTLVRRIRDL